MNRIKRFFIRKHRLLLKIAIILLSTAGIILILFPIYTNIIIANKETRVLSSWEKLKDEKVQETPTEIETLPEEDISESGIIETQEQSAETTQEEIQEPPQVEYTIQDFFPLKINMPDIESEWIVNAGSDPQTLKQGPGYIIGTSLPGQPGRCAIAGHRTTYGAPFNRIDELEDGDIIYLETLGGQNYEYVVKQQLVVNPEDIYVLEGDEVPELLLTTCTPKYSAAKRLIIIAELLDYYKLESYYN